MNRERCIEQIMLDYPTFLARLNFTSSQASVSSLASQCSQVTPENALDFESSSEFVKQQRHIRDWIARNVEHIVDAFPPACPCSPRSTNESVKDSCIYTGCGGNAYLHWKLTKFFETEEEVEKAEVHRKHAVSAIEVALSMLPEKISGGKKIAFYIGSAGVNSLAAVIYWMVGHLSKTEAQINKVLDLLPSCLDPGAPDEILYGRAGYLFCLVFLKKHLTKEVCDRLELKKVAKQVFEVLIAQGKKNSGTDDPDKGLFGSWSRHSWHPLRPSSVSRLVSRPWLVNTIDFILSLQSPDGNFPVKNSHPHRHHLYHWCHGAPGLIYTLYHAHRILGEDKSILRSLDFALKSVWGNGLLKKGFGICHGIAGNGYSFLMMHRHTGSDEYLYAAYKFAEAIRSEEVKKAVVVYVDPQRKRVGVPDRPYSLMEGLGGTICFFCDLLHPKTAAFPGYDGDAA